MERPVSDIFHAFVFNNIMEDTFIFSPRVFEAGPQGSAVNHFIFNDLNLWASHDQFC